MAYIATEDQKAAAGAAPTPLSEPADQTAQNIVISPAGMTEIPVPGQGFVTNAVMTQDGGDLVLESADGVTIIIEGYFSSETPPDLISPDGKVLTPALVKSFIQASTDFAEDKTAMNDTTPVGQVGEVSGHATVTHANGTTETITKGTPIFEGDVVETDAKGAVNIKFADESSFAVSNNAKMAIDEFVFDTASNSGENKFSMLRGLFVYTSGLVGREDPDDVQINTPVGSIGIRGTIITGVLPPDGSTEPAQISVVEGAIVIRTIHGEDITLSKQFETVQIDTANGTSTNVGVLPQGEMAETFNVLRTVSPTLFSAMEEAQQESQPADVPAPQDAAPVEAVPEVQPEAPIQLNLMPDRINKDPLSLDPLGETKEISTETKALEPIADASDTAPVLTISSLIPTPANTADTNPSSNAPNPGAPPTSNVAPVALIGGIYNAFEQAGLTGGGFHQFDIGKFFRDANGDALTYQISGTSGTAGVAGIVSILGSNLLFTVAGGLSTSGTPADFTVDIFATDGSANSASITVKVFAYSTVNGTYAVTGGSDVFNITTSGKRFSLDTGDDQVTFDTGSGANIVFGGIGNDTAYLNSNGLNKFFGEDGDDLIVYGASFTGGAFISGGDGNDTIMASSGGITLYGGSGDDTFSLNNVALLSLNGATTNLLDAGTGFDTLLLSGGGGLNLTNINANALMGIEKIDASATTAVITLDLADIIQHTSDRRLFLDVDAGDSVFVTNTSAINALTAGGTIVEGGDTYNVWSNGNLTLYVNQTAGTVIGL